MASIINLHVKIMYVIQNFHAAFTTNLDQLLTRYVVYPVLSQSTLSLSVEKETQYTHLPIMVIRT